MTIAVFSDFDNPYDGLNATALLFKAVCKMTLAPEKTQTIPLQESSQSAGRTIPELAYLGVVIQGWFRKLDGTWSFGFKCSPSALKAFRRAIKADTPKTHTLSLESLIDRVNPIILGKAAKAVHTYRAIRGECHGATALMRQQAMQLDAYVRQRLRRIRLAQRGVKLMKYLP